MFREIPMTLEETLEELEFQAISYLKESGSQDPAHGPDHIKRVYDLGLEIGKQEGADLKVLGAALLFHDIIRPSDVKGESDHAMKSASFASGVLPAYGYSEKEIESVKEAIVTSSRSGGTGEIPRTIEAKILYDADKIDGGGQIGIDRTIMLHKKRSQDGGVPYDEKSAMKWYLNRITDVLKIGLFTDYGNKVMHVNLKVSLSYIKNVIGGEFEDIMRRDLGEKGAKYLALVE